MRGTKETIILLCPFTGGLLTSACDISAYRGSWLLLEVISVVVLLFTKDVRKYANGK